MGGDAPQDADTASRILDVAERLAQVRGFNGFSYADIASELGITKAALHYHFAGKAELGRVLIARYTDRFGRALTGLDEGAVDAPAKLEGYVSLYAEVLRRERMCLCGMLAAEFETLPVPMRAEVLRFFEESETWLRRVLDEGREEAALRFTGPSDELARAIVSGLEGAMLLTRPYGDVARFQAAARRLLASLTGMTPAVPG